MSKKILVVSDLHVGGNVGLCPDEVYFEKHDEDRKSIYIANKIQNFLFKQWENMIDEAGNIDILLCNGDLVDGKNKHSHGLEMWTTDVDVQTDVSSDLLSMVKHKKAYGTHGSGYHVESNISLDKLAMKNTTKLDFKDDIAIIVDKIRIHAAHFIGNNVQYKSTPIAREMLMGELNKLDYGKINIYLRSHIHSYIAVDSEIGTGIVTPGFKGRDAFVSQRSLGYNPSIGYILIEINGSDYSWTKSVVHLHGNKAIPSYTYKE